MRVPVAGEAALKSEVGLPRAQMALTALRNGFLYRRRMAGVTAYTGDGPVFPSGSCYVSRRTGMTFNTVFFLQRRFCPGRYGAWINQKHRDHCHQE